MISMNWPKMKWLPKGFDFDQIVGRSKIGSVSSGWIQSCLIVDNSILGQKGFKGNKFWG